MGDKELAEAVNRIKPRLHVFGHVHYSSGRTKKHGRTYVNAAQFDNLSGSIRNPPIVVEHTHTIRRLQQVDTVDARTASIIDFVTI